MFICMYVLYHMEEVLPITCTEEMWTWTSDGDCTQMDRH